MKRYTSEKMAIVLEMLKCSKSTSQIIREYGVNESVAYRWRDEALSALQSAFTNKRKAKNWSVEADRERLLKIIGEQAVALEYQKKILMSVSQ